MKRLTRQESREQTRRRLVEAAERLFIKTGFEAASVEQITAEAGFTRGAFYSNFSSKDDLFLEVLERRRLDIQAALDTVFRQTPDPAERYRASRGWYAGQWMHNHWAILNLEFRLRACRSPKLRKRLAAFLEREIEAYSGFLQQYFREAGLPVPENPEALALLLLAASEGLGTLALLGSGFKYYEQIAAASGLAFDRMVGAAQPSRES